MVRNGELLED